MRMRDEGLQVGVRGWRWRVMQRRVAPRVKLRLRQHQNPPHSILLNDLKTEPDTQHGGNKQKQKEEKSPNDIHCEKN